MQEPLGRTPWDLLYLILSRTSRVLTIMIFLATVLFFTYSFLNSEKKSERDIAAITQATQSRTELINKVLDERISAIEALMVELVPAQDAQTPPASRELATKVAELDTKMNALFEAIKTPESAIGILRVARLQDTVVSLRGEIAAGNRETEKRNIANEKVLALNIKQFQDNIDRIDTLFIGLMGTILAAALAALFTWIRELTRRRAQSATAPKPGQGS